jgi:ribonuclease J
MDELPAGSPLRLIPLGGLGEFGLNAMVLDWEGHLLLLDAGVLFANAELPGVDSIVPDFAYLADRRERLHGILLTHGHEDHIGALGVALEVASAPVYGSRLTLGFAARRLRERDIKADLRTLVPGQPVTIGPFRVHPIRVAHSVVDSLALAIETPAGVVLLSGDFKIDPHAAPEERTDVAALAEWGQRGVLVLLSDSTNVEHRGTTPGEDSVLPAFREVFEKARGRVLVTCFATSIPRIQRVANLARTFGRRVAFVGRRMTDNCEVASELGLLDIPLSATLSATGLADASPGKLVAFVSGSQGEPLSALSLISVGEHRDIAVGPGDTVVFSARPIPGNERAVSRVMSNLYRRGCEVVHSGHAAVHVSGHGNREDLIELLKLTRPRYLVPVHGEYRMLVQHAALAREAGLDGDQALIVEDGDVLAFHEGQARREGRVAAGRILVDRSSGSEVEEIVVRDRRHLSADGIVVPIVVLDKQTGQLEGMPEIVTRGVLDSAEETELLDDATRLLAETVGARPAEELADPSLLRERVRLELRRFFKKRMQRRPIVIPVVMEV